MSATFYDALMMGAEQELASLLATRGLNTEDLHRISRAMSEHNLTFGKAAVQLGLATTQDVESALELVRNSGVPQRPPGSIIETVVRKLSASRALVVREGPRVRPSAQLVLAHDPYHPYSEQIRALRTELQLRCPMAGKAVVLAVLSPGSAEGRSQLSAELAIAYAQLGARTLLIDADFRGPCQHKLFDCENASGLSQALDGDEQPYLRSVEGVPHLGLLASGPVPPNPLEMLSDGRFARCVARWRDRYDMILIDTPPLSRAYDALAAAALAGRVLILTRAKHTLHGATREMLRRLVNTQAQIVGAVVGKF